MRAFVQPPCGESHGEDCPDWACTECGTGLVNGFTVRVPQRPGSSRRRADAA